MGEKFAALRTQSVTSSCSDSPDYDGRRTAPQTLTNQGVAKLSTVLRTPCRISVNVEIMRTFVRVWALSAKYGNLAKLLAELEEKTEALPMNHDTFSRNARTQFKHVFDALKELTPPRDPPKRPIGFVITDDKSKKSSGSAKSKT